jgi:hypothetical protein
MRAADAHFTRLMDKPALRAQFARVSHQCASRRGPRWNALQTPEDKRSEQNYSSNGCGACQHARRRRLVRYMHSEMAPTSERGGSRDAPFADSPSEHEVSCHTLVLPAGSGQEGVPTLDLSNRHYIRRGGCVDDPRSLWGFFASRVRCPGYRPTLITTFGASIGLNISRAARARSQCWAARVAR